MATLPIDQHHANKTTSTIKKVTLAGLGLACATAATVGMVGMTSPHFSHDHMRILQQFANAHAVQATLHPRTGSRLFASSDVTIHASLFPKTNANGDLNSMEFDGALSYQFLNQLYNFTLVDNRGFWSIQDADTREIITQDCLHQDNIPPIHTLKDALINARVIDDVKRFDVKCDNGQLVEFMFANEPFVFCSRSNGAVDKVHSEDFHMSLEFLEAHSEGVPSRETLLRVPQGVDMGQCEPLTTAQTGSSPVTTRQLFAKATMRAKDMMQVARGQRRLGLFDTKGSCDTCPNGKKPCLFVHGLGTKEHKGLVDSYPEYWGNIKEYAPCCSSIGVTHLETINNEWYNANLTTEVCNAAKTMAEDATDPMNIEGLVLVTHSMGNLMAASAMTQKKCGLGKTSKWIAISAPMLGSMSSTSSLGICSNPYHPIRGFCDRMGYCPVRGAMKSIMFQGSVTSTPELDARYDETLKVFRSRVDSQLCGISSVGLLTKDSPTLVMTGISSHHKSKHDGMVEINSCAADMDQSVFGPSWRDNRFYLAHINHFDGQLKNGDGLWGDSRKPLKWLQCQF